MMSSEFPRSIAAPAGGAEKLLYPPSRSKKDTPPVEAVRGFVFTSGIGWMKERGLVERYRELLPAGERDRMMLVTAASWIPLEEALIAYRACDALGLSMDDQVELGRVVSNANNGVVLRTIMQLVGKVSSPWTALGRIDRMWQSSNRGGAIAVYKLGTHQARLEFWRCPLARSAFFRTSMRGAIAVGIEPFCDRVVVNEIAHQNSPDGFALRLSW
jgi:hypothetical protein